MTEWGVVLVIISLVGLISAVVGPLTKLTKSITTLTVVVERLRDDQAEQKKNAKTSHQHLWEHNEKQDEKLEDHEKRIFAIENK